MMTIITIRVLIYHDDNHDPDKNVPQDAKWSLVSVIALVTVWAAWFALVRLLDFRYKYDIIIIVTIIITIIIITIINITVTVWAIWFVLVRLLELIYKYYFMIIMIMIIKDSTFNKNILIRDPVCVMALVVSALIVLLCIYARYTCLLPWPWSWPRVQDHEHLPWPWQIDQMIIFHLSFRKLYEFTEFGKADTKLELMSKPKNIQKWNNLCISWWLNQATYFWARAQQTRSLLTEQTFYRTP